jgi:hypothetical protein
MFHVPVTGCIRNIPVPNPPGGLPKQIGCTADLSCFPAGMTRYVPTLYLIMRIAIGASFIVEIKQLS